jgi:hypothetical protein
MVLKVFVFYFTMQCLDEIIQNCSIKTNKLANAHHFILKNRVSFMAKDGKLKTGYIIHFSNEYISAMTSSMKDQLSRKWQGQM